MWIVEETAAGAADPFEVGHGERLLVWTWRKIVTGHGCCPLVARAYADLCGEDAAEVLATLYTFLRALAHAGRNRPRVGHPGCVGITSDERRFLTLVAAAQSGDEALFEAHLRWLAHVESRITLTIAARALARALGTHGVRLPMPGQG